MLYREHPFRNVAVPVDDHAKLQQIAEREDRSMARQLAVMIREKHRELFAGGSPPKDRAKA